ncbi:hypothetical protein EHQ12_13100 [Leptospira gomenensis]|uniref:Uncharacterized protein n=1 Tax=Leptospira gomenensis TaxID=2484974 RepID=A0A5F1YRU8_9LEPT|nr:hypothetical protein [Leptospira gomenensis]TGK28139.1 hypothetical protein EHQ17_18860 [Leptospira gomenensis]TGK37005.1 hypothetical protein EHQ12_13100 [Leptospira gomenensis]TGK45641.1 hypothetical protein EHQ07_08115 [Leptospira gomenensis]TGK59580.1 hypothetical protein EHQ13_12325 [Leptospira gomenensis]
MESTEQDINFEELAGAKPVEIQSLMPDYIFLNEGAVGLSSTARCILDELRDWHKKTEKHGSKSIHPSYLLTLDKLGELLNKYRNLSEQAKSPQSVDLALRQLVDYDKRGKNKSAYIYPFLVRNGAKVLAKVAIAAPQKEAKTDVTPYRVACFEFSEEMIDLVLQNRAKKPKLPDEDNPGAFLLHKNKAGKNWLFPKLASIEAEFSTLLKRGFQPYGYIPMTDFLRDFVTYSLKKNFVMKILPDYHIILDDLQLNPDGSYVNQPEVVAHYRCQADALEKFAIPYLKELSERAGYSLFRNRIAEFEQTHVQMVEPGRKQNKEKVKALISLINDYPFDREPDELGKKISETCRGSIQVLSRLMEEMDKLSQRKEESVFKSLKARILQQITDNTLQEQTLYKFSPEQKLKSSGLLDETRYPALIEELKRDITAQFGMKEVERADQKTDIYAVDHGYMAAVLHKLNSLAVNNPAYQKDLQIAKEINASLSNPKHPGLNAKLKAENIVKLQQGIQTMEQIENERKRSREFAKKFNLPMGMLGFVASMILFLIASVYFRTTGILFVGIPVSIFFGLMLAFYFREREKTDIFASGGNSSSLGSGFKGEYGATTSSSEDYYSGDDSDEEHSYSKGETPKEKKVSLIAKGAERFVFPSRFTKITDKIHDSRSLRKKIFENLDNIRNSVAHLKSEKDDDKVASTIEYALLQNSATILIPDDIVPQGMPGSIILSHTDLKAPLIRDQISEFLRNEAQKKKYDKKLVKYYTFLINTIEVEYYKYLPSRKKR